MVRCFDRQYGRFDETAGKCYEIDNITGKRKEINFTGEPIRRYNIGISGIAKTKQRKEFAKKDNIFDLNIPIDMHSKNKEYYNPTTNKLLGTAQFPRPLKKNTKRIGKRKKRGGKASQSVGQRDFQMTYPSYFCKPQWHDTVLKEMKKGKGKNKEEIYNIYKDFFKGLDPISDKAKRRLVNAKMSIDKRKKVRKLKPLTIEYIHLERYKSQMRDPKQKKAFFRTDADLAENALIKSEVFVNQTLQNSIQAHNFVTDFKTTTFEKDQKFLIKNNESNIKTKKEFDNDLLTQKHHIGALKLQNTEKTPRKLLKGTIGAPIQSEKSWYKKSRAFYKNLYPQLFVEKINKAAFMSSARVVQSMKSYSQKVKTLGGATLETHPNQTPVKEK